MTSKHGKCYLYPFHFFICVKVKAGGKVDFAYILFKQIGRKIQDWNVRGFRFVRVILNINVEGNLKLY
jgi:hypothetical protein